MKNEFKYTTDGRKVVVIGNLNSQEKIVQEIFVSNGIEIPSGENFVVKSLHDSPSKSWKELEVEKINSSYEKTKNQYNLELKRLRDAYRKECSELREKIKYTANAVKNVSEDSFNTLLMFLTDEIKYIVINRYGTIKLVEWSEFNQLYNERLRLLSIFGSDNGTLTYKIGQFYDYSGDHTTFYPFKTKEEALVKLEELVLNKGITEDNLKIAKEYGIKFKQEDIDKYKEDLKEMYKRNIESYSKNIQQSNDKIKEIDNLEL